MGATLDPTDTGDVYVHSGDKFMAPLCEFEAHLPESLAKLTHASMRAPADLIDLNFAH